MTRLIIVAEVLAVALGASTTLAIQPSLPPAFQTQTISSPEGAEIVVRHGGAGPAVVLIHGYGETSSMWGPLADELAGTHSVIVPDLRGLGRSSRPAGGYDKKTQAADIRAVVTFLGFDRTSLVGHDIGNMVAYAYAARYPGKVDRLVVMDAPLPGIQPWDDLVRSRASWYFSTRAGSAQFATFAQDADDNRAFQRTKLTMPILAIGGELSFGAVMAIAMRQVGIDVREAVVPGAGHWLMAENPAFTVALVREFLDRTGSSRSADSE